MQLKCFSIVIGSLTLPISWWSGSFFQIFLVVSTYVFVDWVTTAMKLSLACGGIILAGLKCLSTQCCATVSYRVVQLILSCCGRLVDSHIVTAARLELFAVVQCNPLY